MILTLLRVSGQGINQFLESIPPFFIILEHIETGTGRG